MFCTTIITKSTHAMSKTKYTLNLLASDTSNITLWSIMYVATYFQRLKPKTTAGKRLLRSLTRLTFRKSNGGLILVNWIQDSFVPNFSLWYQTYFAAQIRHSHFRVSTNTAITSNDETQHRIKISQLKNGRKTILSLRYGREHRTLIAVLCCFDKQQ